MTPEEKQSALQRYRAILLATLNYLEEHLGGSFVCDQYDPVLEYYQQQKLQTEKYFKERKLDRLQQQLARLTKGLQNSAHANFNGYVKEKTGYEIDIFQDLRTRVDAIVEQDEIRSEKELHDIITMLHFNEEMSQKAAETIKLQSLLNRYPRNIDGISPKRKREHTELISREEKDGLVKETYVSWTGSKPKHFDEQVLPSPNGKRKLRVTQWGDNKSASTYITVEFPTASGAVYATNGIHPDVSAWWKDDSTIVIETKKEYQANTKYNQVRSFQDIIDIEYIEH